MDLVAESYDDAVEVIDGPGAVCDLHHKGKWVLHAHEAQDCVLLLSCFCRVLAADDLMGPVRASMGFVCRGSARDGSGALCRELPGAEGSGQLHSAGGLQV